MHTSSESPFAIYLRRIDASLRGLPAEKRSAIQRELLAHLHDAASEASADPTDPLFQQQVIGALGAERAVAAQFIQVYGGLPQLLRRMGRIAGLLGGVLGMLVAPFTIILSGDVWWSYRPSLALFVAAGGLGMWGVLRDEWGKRGGLWRAALGAGILLIGGAQMFYVAHQSLDWLSGLALLVAGELLLLFLAINGAAAALPRVPRGLLLIGGLLLVTFVQPFSALPNPLGAYYFYAGGYRYDPRLPFVNRFATVRDSGVVPLVTMRLDTLIGQTGLTPLDPHLPLRAYTVRGIVTGTRFAWSTVTVDLHFADGSTRQVDIPAVNSRAASLTGIDGLATPHLPIPGLPPADASAPIHLGELSRLPLPATAERLIASSGVWLDATNVRWSPNGQALLIRAAGDSPAVDEPADDLWFVPLAGTPPRLLQDAATDALWSADGRTVVALQEGGPLAGSVWQRTITAIDVASGVSRAIGATDRAEVAVIGDAVFFLNERVLWRAPLHRGSAERIAVLPEANGFFGVSALAVSPDAQRVAYRCWSDLCLTDRFGRLLAQVPLGFQPPQPLPGDENQAPDAVPSAPYVSSFALAWSPDGQHLALATTATQQRGRPELRVLTRDGAVTSVVSLGPDGAVDPPQWHPDGQTLVLTTYPLGGRRIVTVDVARGVAFDLTQPRWDTFASLAPDGTQLLLWNERGAAWLAPLR